MFVFARLTRVLFFISYFISYHALSVLCILIYWRGLNVQLNGGTVGIGISDLRVRSWGTFKRSPVLGLERREKKSEGLISSLP